MTVKGEINRNTEAVHRADANAQDRFDELSAILTPLLVALLEKMGESRGVEIAVRLEFLPTELKP